jgi:hypothetical protein
MQLAQRIRPPFLHPSMAGESSFGEVFENVDAIPAD